MFAKMSERFTPGYGWRNLSPVAGPAVDCAGAGGTAPLEKLLERLPIVGIAGIPVVEGA